MLVEHIDGYRRIWMFPRNIRAIYPWKMAQILMLVNDSLRGYSWSGSIGIQERFCKALEETGLKRAGMQYDPNSGGPRTYLAQLKALGLFFDRDDRTTWLTIAGEELVNGNNPLLVMQQQLFRHQYPSFYGTSSQVKIHPNLKVKPFLFIMKLCDDPDLNGITYEEMMVPVIYGHNHDCYDLCRDKILEWRETGRLRIDSPGEELYTPRGCNRTEDKALNDIKDIANTFKNCLEANNLITKNDEGYYIIRETYRRNYESAMEEYNVFLSVEIPEKFQRSYGRGNRNKDTRRLLNKQEDTLLKVGETIIIAKFMEYCGNRIVTDIPKEFIEGLHARLGFSRSEVEYAIRPFMAKSLDVYEATYMKLSCGGATAGLDFEKATASLFENSLHFKTELIGQTRRDGVGGYADILLIPMDIGKCAIVDTKASGQYNLPASDYRAMVNDYCTNYSELSHGRKIEFCTYVVGDFSGRVHEKLVQMQKESGVPSTGITASKLLQLAKIKPSPDQQQQVRNLFMRSGVIDEIAL